MCMIREKDNIIYYNIKLMKINDFLVTKLEKVGLKAEIPLIQVFCSCDLPCEHYPKGINYD